MTATLTREQKRVAAGGCAIVHKPNQWCRSCMPGQPVGPTASEVAEVKRQYKRVVPEYTEARDAAIQALKEADAACEAATASRVELDRAIRQGGAGDKPAPEPFGIMAAKDPELSKLAASVSSYVVARRW